MSTTGRLALVGVTLAVAIVAFVVIQSGGSDSGGSGKGTESAQIKVRHGKPVGGVKKISLTKGDTLRLTVSSPDTKQEIHVHGYDLKRDMAPGSPASFKFKANIEGAFEIELEDTATKIANLSVQPG